jgi:hypothetical protein
MLGLYTTFWFRAKVGNANAGTIIRFASGWTRIPSMAQEMPTIQKREQVS